MTLFKKTIVSVSSILVGLTLSTSVSFAEDFSAGSNAKEYGLEEEVKTTFSATVVDMVCEIAGDCTDNCGNGERQLGLLRDADNKLIAVLKNGQFSFNGAAEDLLPYCNKKVDVDGLMIGDPEEFNTQFYMVQLIRDAGSEKWNKANRWTKKWAERNPEAKGKGPWFRRDPRVKKQVEAAGYFGLGKDADIKYAEENQ